MVWTRWTPLSTHRLLAASPPRTVSRLPVSAVLRGTIYQPRRRGGGLRGHQAGPPSEARAALQGAETQPRLRAVERGPRGSAVPSVIG